MNRKNTVPFKPPAALQGAAPSYQQAPHGSVGMIPRGFREAMRHISEKLTENSSIGSSDVAKTKLAPKTAVTSSASKWKSSFKPLDGEDDDMQEKSTGSQERSMLYDPYNPDSSDSEHEMPHGQDQYHISPNQNSGAGPQSKSRWDKPYCKPRSQASNSHDLRPEMQPTNSRGPSPDHGLPEQVAHHPDFESVAPPSYSSSGRPVHHRLGSPDRSRHDSSPQRFPASYGAQRTNGDDGISVPEYRREMIATDRLSPSRLKRDYQHHLGNEETGLDTPDVTRNTRKVLVMDKIPISCDLCDVELANGQELQDHLESKTHWDTLEHIQQQNNYNDVTIAFLQEVMLCKSRECSRAISDSLLQALQENDHMTKIEVFHCAACNIFLSTSSTLVHSHLTSQEHLTNTKEFKVRQRRACLDTAETIIQKLKPQFEHFLQGGSPFE